MLKQYKTLESILSETIENIYASIDKGEPNEHFITIGIDGKNFDFPLCADLYENAESLIKNMIDVEGEN